MGSLLSNAVNRRRLLGTLGIAGAGAAVTAAAPVAVRVETGSARAASTSHEHGAAAVPAANAQEMTPDEMDAMHEAGVKAFPAPTEGLGGQPLSFEMDGDVKVFRLTCQVVNWEYAPGQRAEAWTYNGVVPGPEIRVTEGDKVRVLVTNELPESTAVHWHGLVVPNAMDGVPFITQPPIKPGETFTYEFQVREGNAGSHMYHSHHNAAVQVTKGLLGALSRKTPRPGQPMTSSTR
jgi:FtsP/CotA-like multicopper oxidase with cupredoxin domain